MSSREACSPLHLFINHQSYIINQQTIKKLGASSNGHELLEGGSSNSTFYKGHCISPHEGNVAMLHKRGPLTYESNGQRLPTNFPKKSHPHA